MPHFHLVALARWPIQPFRDRALCHSAWGDLRAAFRRTLGAVLMPDHLHIVVAAEDGAEARRQLIAAMVGFSRRFFPARGLWESFTEPKLAYNDKHLLRHARYVHLNPCRDRLAADPLEWEWSTHRDAVGAVADPWLDVPRLARALKVEPSRFPAAFHRYVSSDPTVAIAGTSLPPKPKDARNLIVPADALEWAIRESCHAPGDYLDRRDPARRLFVRMASQLGWGEKQRVADRAGISGRTARRILALPPAPGEAAALQAATYLLSAAHRFRQGPVGGHLPPVAPPRTRPKFHEPDFPD